MSILPVDEEFHKLREQVAMLYIQLEYKDSQAKHSLEIFEPYLKSMYEARMSLMKKVLDNSAAID